MQSAKSPICLSPTIPRSRGGVALLSTIVCVAILSALAASLLHSILAQKREVDRQAVMLQAEALAQSALDRGFQQLVSNPAYAGEVWTPVVPGSQALKAEIVWTGSPMGGQLHVTCLVPADAPLPVRVERTASLSLVPPTPDKTE